VGCACATPTWRGCCCAINVSTEGPSPFFGSLLPSRSAQVVLGRGVRDMLQSRLPEYRTAMAAAVAEFAAVSRWPAAGVDLVYRCTSDLLLHPSAPPGLRRLQHLGTRDGLGRHRTASQRARAEIRRAQLDAALAEYVSERRKQVSRSTPPRDFLDAVVVGCPEEVANRVVSKIYLMLLRPIVEVVGHSVAWAILLAGLHHPTDSAWP
jgi:hypothetical protein